MIVIGLLTETKGDRKPSMCREDCRILNVTESGNPTGGIDFHIHRRNQRQYSELFGLIGKVVFIQFGGLGSAGGSGDHIQTYRVIETLEDARKLGEELTEILERAVPVQGVKTGRLDSSKSNPSNITSPRTFRSRMAAAAKSKDYEGAHGDADELMCETLKQLGYGAGIKVYETIKKW